MNVQALMCSRCGGPLSHPESMPAMIDCLFCGAVNSVTREAITQSREADDWELRKVARQRFNEALVAALKAGRPSYEALRECSAAHLGVAGRADTVARISLALARDFERENEITVVRDPLVLARIAEAYLRALDDLRTSDTVEINLPFLAATSRGPVHLARKASAKLFAELAARDPLAKVAEPAPPKAEPPTPIAAEPPKKKKGWWPFS